jgi:hypothetical protein
MRTGLINWMTLSGSNIAPINGTLFSTLLRGTLFSPPLRGKNMQKIISKALIGAIKPETDFD